MESVRFCRSANRTTRHSVRNRIKYDVFSHAGLLISVTRVKSAHSTNISNHTAPILRMASGEQSVIHRTGSIVGVIQEAQTSSQLPTVLQTTTRKINLWLGTANKRYDVFVSTKKSSDSALVLISAISLE